MKHITKRGEPESFAKWKASGTAEWQPEYSNMPSQIKSVLKSALISEQGCICCYCESKLADKNSHIEHFKPQSNSEADPLDFKNMLCSCQNQLKRGEPLHCGNYKSNWFDAELLISPLNRNCEDHFSFTGNGGILPRDENDRKAIETIRRLGLNIPKLIDMRAKAIEPFLDDSLSHQEFSRLVVGYLEKDKSGAFGAYWTTIYYLFRELATL